MPDPSLRYLIVNVWGDTQSSRTEYILGRNSRSEYRDCRTVREGDPNQPGTTRVEYGPLRALIQNRQVHSQFHIDLDARVYTAWHLPEYPSPTGLKARARAHKPSGRTVHVHTETIDTGDRREMF